MAEPKDLSTPLEQRADPLAAGGIDPESVSAIDSHFDALAKGREETPEDKPADTPPVDKPGDNPPAEEPVVATKDAADQTPEAPSPVDKQVDKPASDKPVSDKPDSDKPASDKPPEQPAVKVELYPEVKLPPTARGASAEAFATVKARAAQDIAARDQQIETLKKDLAQAQEQTKGLVPAKDVEALQKEVEGLRAFRTKLDIQADPTFAARFDQRVSTANEFIYSRLKASGAITDDTLKKIRDLGGPGSVDMQPVLDRIEDAQTKRTIQSKLDELEGISFEREQALKEAQANVGDYVQKRREEFQKTASAHNDATKEVLTSILAQVPWMVPPKVATDATAEQKEAAKAHETFLGELNKTLADALQDDTPQMRAVLISGLAQHLHLRRAHEALIAERDALKKDLDAAKAQAAEVTGKLDAVKRAGSARRDTNAPASGKVTGTSNQLATADEAFAAWEANRGQQ